MLEKVVILMRFLNLIKIAKEIKNGLESTKSIVPPNGKLIMGNSGKRYKAYFKKELLHN